MLPEAVVLGRQCPTGASSYVDNGHPGPDRRPPCAAEGTQTHVVVTWSPPPPPHRASGYQTGSASELPFRGGKSGGIELSYANPSRTPSSLMSILSQRSNCVVPPGSRLRKTISAPNPLVYGVSARTTIAALRSSERTRILLAPAATPTSSSKDLGRPEIIRSTVSARRWLVRTGRSCPAGIRHPHCPLWTLGPRVRFPIPGGTRE